MPTNPRPARGSGGSQQIFAGTLALFAGALLTAVMPLFGVAWMVGGVILVAGAVRKATFGVASTALAGSFHAIGRGALSEANALLDGVSTSRFAWVRRIALIQRAVIALRRGDVEVARDRLDEAIALPLGMFARANSAYQIEAALALRSFARASLGDYEGSRRDAEAVRSRPGASAESLARVALAEALILDRTGERDALRALLDRDKGLLLESCHPRERAIVRAYQRMLKVATASVYRRAGEREQEVTGDEPPLVDWVAKVAPSAAPFVRVPRFLHAKGEPVPALRQPTGAAYQAVMKARGVAAKAAVVPLKVGKFVAYAGAGALGISAILALLVATLKGGGSFDWLDQLPGVATLFVVSLLVTAIIGTSGTIGAVQVARRLRKPRRAELVGLEVARAAVGRGDFDGATKKLAGLAASQHEMVAVQAHALAAEIAERGGDAEAMLTACDAGLGRLAGARDAIAGRLRPELIARRAVALAILDRFDEASAELGSLSGMPYAMLGRDMFLVRLIELVRSGELDAAARWVEQGAADLPLGVRDELLADLVRAIAAPGSAGLGEIERLKDELRTSPENKRWIQAVAPDVIERFTGAVEGDDAVPLRIAVDAADHEHLAEAEAEAALVEDAVAAPRRI